MTFKPMTYFISFTLFVVLFLSLGVYLGFGKISDHFLTQSYLDAISIGVHVSGDENHKTIRWEDKILLNNDIIAHVSAINQQLPITIHYSDEIKKNYDNSPKSDEIISIANNERIEDIRIDKNAHYLFTRTHLPSGINSKEATWIYKYDLHSRKLLSRTSVNPIFLPVPFQAVPKPSHAASGSSPCAEATDVPHRFSLPGSPGAPSAARGGFGTAWFRP